jgi:hypothetical protein
MIVILRSALTAVLIAASVQVFTVGVLSDGLPREVCRPDVRVTWERRFPAQPTLHISNNNGHVNVVGYGGVEIVVNATISAYVRDYEERELAEAYIETLGEVTQEGWLLRITTEPRDRPEPVDLTVNYDVQVPAGTNVTVDAQSGNVFIGQGVNDVIVRSHRSDIEIREPRGSVMARTTNGRIDLHGARKQATLRTVNGNIRAVFPGTALLANTVNGDIFTTLPARGAKECDLTTTNGAIRIVMHPECSAEVNAITREGMVTSQFEVVPLTLEQKRSELRGFIGQAETSLTLSTFSGDISIERSMT